MISKQERQKLILDIIQDNIIASQEELLAQLIKHGVETTQTTVSRDIRAMNIIRQKSDSGQLRYQQLNDTTKNVQNLVTTNAVDGAIKEYASFVTHVEFLTIIKTTDGSGNSVAGIIDDANLPEVITTLAGFNTIYVTSKNETDAAKLADHWAELIG